MAITVQIPTALRRHTDGVGKLDCSAANISELFSVLDEKFPQLKPHLRDEAGEIRRFRARSTSSLYFVARSARDVLSAARMTGTMIPSSASTAMPTSMEFDCTTRLPINFAAAPGVSARASARARTA